MKDKTTAIILSALLGGLGVDRFYLGYTGMGILKLLTGGVFGVLWILDIINIATGKLQPADGSGYTDNTLVITTQPKQDVYTSLEKVAALHSQGVLTDEEYNKMKADLLGKM